MTAVNTARTPLHEPRYLDCGSARPAYFPDDPNSAAVRGAWSGQLLEDAEFYVPDMLSDSDYKAGAKLRSAADDRSHELHKAWRHVDEARLLSAVLRASMDDACDDRAMQIDTVLRLVEKKLGKAYTQIDRHDRSHRNLFIAYADLKASVGAAALRDTVHS